MRHGDVGGFWLSCVVSVVVLLVEFVLPFASVVVVVVELLVGVPAAPLLVVVVVSVSRVVWLQPAATTANARAAASGANFANVVFMSFSFGWTASGAGRLVRRSAEGRTARAARIGRGAGTGTTAVATGRAGGRRSA